MATEAIRQELQRRGIPLGPVVVRPHERGEHAAVLYHPGPRRGSWRSVLERWID